MLRIAAHIFSFLFHPLLVPTYMLLLLLVINPYLFGVNSLGDQISQLLLIRIFISTFFIPIIAIVLLKFLGMIQSFELKDKQERIGPYIITGIFYLWMVRNFIENPQIPTAYTSFVLGATIALFVAFFINIFSKISVHAVGMGGLLGMIVITMLWFSYDSFSLSSGLGTVQLNMNIILMIGIIIAGVVGSSRLILEAHEPQDLYGGFLVGFATQFIALRFLF